MHACLHGAGCFKAYQGLCVLALTCQRHTVGHGIGGRECHVHLLLGGLCVCVAASGWQAFTPSTRGAECCLPRAGRQVDNNSSVCYLSQEVLRQSSPTARAAAGLCLPHFRCIVTHAVLWQV